MINEGNSPEIVSIPISLAKSMQGKYFVGYADHLTFGMGTNAWGALYNPPNSGVHLHVNVWTVSNVIGPPIRSQIWFNCTAPGIPVMSPLITAANFAITPIPEPKVRIYQSGNVIGDPIGGTKAFVRRIPPTSTIVAEEDGKFIFPPGGLFLIFLSNPEAPNQQASGRIAFGWWEEPQLRNIEEMD